MRQIAWRIFSSACIVVIVGTLAIVTWGAVALASRALFGPPV